MAQKQPVSIGVMMSQQKKHHKKHHKKQESVAQVENEAEIKAKVLAAEAAEDKISDIIGSKTSDVLTRNKFDSAVSEFDKLEKNVYKENHLGQLQSRHQSDNYQSGEESLAQYFKKKSQALMQT